mgnify:CR=1 FL=1
MVRASNSARMVMPSRPSQAFTGFVQHLMHEIALGVGVPEGVLFGTQDYKGPSVRAEFAAADRVFTRQQGVLTDKVLDPIKAMALAGSGRDFRASFIDGREIMAEFSVIGCDLQNSTNTCGTSAAWPKV